MKDVPSSMFQIAAALCKEALKLTNFWVNDKKISVYELIRNDFILEIQPYIDNIETTYTQIFIHAPIGFFKKPSQLIYSLSHLDILVIKGSLFLIMKLLLYKFINF